MRLFSRNRRKYLFCQDCRGRLWENLLRQRIRNSLAMGWWKNVSADELYSWIENDDEINLMIAAQITSTDETKTAAWNVVISAMAYVTWQVYQSERQKKVPQLLEGIDDVSMLDEISEFAQKSGAFDPEFSVLLFNFLNTNHKNGENMGQPILRDDINQFAAHIHDTTK